MVSVPRSPSPVGVPLTVVPSSSVRVAPQPTLPISSAPRSLTLRSSSVAPPLPSLPPCSMSSVLPALTTSPPVSLPVIVVPPSSVRVAPEFKHVSPMVPLSITLTPSSVTLAPAATSSALPAAIVNVPVSLPIIAVPSPRATSEWFPASPILRAPSTVTVTPLSEEPPPSSVRISSVLQASTVRSPLLRVTSLNVVSPSMSMVLATTPPELASVPSIVTSRRVSPDSAKVTPPSTVRSPWQKLTSQNLLSPVMSMVLATTPPEVASVPSIEPPCTVTPDSVKMVPPSTANTALQASWNVVPVMVSLSSLSVAPLSTCTSLPQAMLPLSSPLTPHKTSMRPPQLVSSVPPVIVTSLSCTTESCPAAEITPHAVLQTLSSISSVPPEVASSRPALRMV